MESLTQATLCLLLRGEPPTQVLLGYKKAGFGQGKYTGFGGKVEDGENVEAAARREMQEEAGVLIAPQDLRYAARLTFLFPAKPGWSQVVHVFTATTWEGEPMESDEMIPAWFGVDEIPYHSMWSDGRHWLPPILAGRRIQGRFIFAEDNESVREVFVEEMK